MDSSESAKPKRVFGYGPPTQTGMIPFTPPGTNRKCETAYWLWGDLAAGTPPLIILHGGPAAPGRDWKVVTVLSEQRGVPVLLYDQIGGGVSTHLRDTKGDTGFWSMDLFMAELDNLRRHLEIESFDLLGHSCGGMIAASYALTQPRGLRKLIIASCAASEALRAFGQQRLRDALPGNLPDIFRTCEEEERFGSPEYQSAMVEYMRRHLCRMDPWPAELEEAMALLMEDDTVGSTLYGGRPLKPTGPWKDYSVEELLSEITDKTTPGGVLLTHGQYDMTPDEGMAPYFQKIRARVKWVRFGKSSHTPHLEEAAEYLAVLGDFLTTP